MRYRERLYPSAGIVLAVSLSFPMILLAALPFGTEVGFLIAAVGWVLLLALIFIFAPSIEVTDTELTAGRFRLPLSVLGDASVLSKEELKHLIGVGADARAQLLIRGYVKSALRINLDDKDDPTPYVVISTRKPNELAVALLANRS